MTLCEKKCSKCILEGVEDCPTIQEILDALEDEETPVLH